MSGSQRHRMTKEDTESWNATYEYMKKVLGYDDNQMLPRSLVLRLKGLVTGKFMANNSIPDNAHYSYQVLLMTLKYSTPDIKRALNNVRFHDEGHKINYVMRIIENNINTVYMRMKSVNTQKAEAAKAASSEIGTSGVEYRPDKKVGKKDRFSDLW